MAHLTDDQILHLAELYNADEFYDDAAVEALHHIGECEACYDTFCCAAAILQVAYPAQFLPDYVETELSVLEKEDLPISAILTTIHVYVQKTAENIIASMEQLVGSISDWVFEPSLSLAGARALDGEKANPASVSLEDIDSRYTFVNFDANTGDLHIQIDTEESPGAPEKIILRFPDGETQELTLAHGDRFITADAFGIKAMDFEILFS